MLLFLSSFAIAMLTTLDLPTLYYYSTWGLIHSIFYDAVQSYYARVNQCLHSFISLRTFLSFLFAPSQRLRHFQERIVKTHLKCFGHASNELLLFYELSPFEAAAIAGFLLIFFRSSFLRWLKNKNHVKIESPPFSPAPPPPSATHAVILHEASFVKFIFVFFLLLKFPLAVSVTPPPPPPSHAHTLFLPFSRLAKGRQYFQITFFFHQ